MAQPGSAPEWGSGGRAFESLRPDHFVEHEMAHRSDPRGRRLSRVAGLAADPAARRTSRARVRRSRGRCLGRVQRGARLRSLGWSRDAQRSTHRVASWTQRDPRLRFGQRDCAERVAHSARASDLSSRRPTTAPMPRVDVDLVGRDDVGTLVRRGTRAGRQGDARRLPASSSPWVLSPEPAHPDVEEQERHRDEQEEGAELPVVPDVHRPTASRRFGPAWARGPA